MNLLNIHVLALFFSNHHTWINIFCISIIKYSIYINILTYIIVCNIYKNLTRLFRFFFSFFSFYICSCYTHSYIYKQIICFSVTTKIIEYFQKTKKKKIIYMFVKNQPKFLTNLSLPKKKKIQTNQNQPKPKPKKNQRPIKNQNIIDKLFDSKNKTKKRIKNPQPAFKFVPKTTIYSLRKLRNSKFYVNAYSNSKFQIQMYFLHSSHNPKFKKRPNLTKFSLGDPYIYHTHILYTRFIYIM